MTLTMHVFRVHMYYSKVHNIWIRTLNSSLCVHKSLHTFTLSQMVDWQCAPHSSNSSRMESTLSERLQFTQTWSPGPEAVLCCSWWCYVMRAKNEPAEWSAPLPRPPTHDLPCGPPHVLLPGVTACLPSPSSVLVAACNHGNSTVKHLLSWQHHNPCVTMATVKVNNYRVLASIVRAHQRLHRSLLHWWECWRSQCHSPSPLDCTWR